MTLLLQHDWPGNVRELKNAIERLVILSGDASTIDAGAIQDMLPAVKPVKTKYARGVAFRDLSAAAEREIILAALEANASHIANTARELQLERSHLYKKMKALGIQPRGTSSSDVGDDDEPE
jgi:DNA-binding NtrC family response regulator